jgi:hypothetical protein
MATKIILKKSNVAGAIPLTSDLEIGEVALNLADRKLFTKNNSGNVVAIGSAFVGTTAPAAPSEGDLWYDTATNYLKTYNGTAWINAGFTQLTEFGVTASAAELNILDGATLSTTELNYLDGVTSGVQSQLDGKANLSGATFTGPVTINGVLSSTGISNTGPIYSTGDIYGYGGLTIAGGMAIGGLANFNSGIEVFDYVNLKPNGPNGIVGGKYLIDGVQHTHLAEDVTDFEEAVEDLIGANVVAGTAISVVYNDTTGTTTVTNTAPDQTVTITAGTAITVTGSYPNFTVAHTDTSSQASVDNTGATVIQDVTLDANGHVTGLGSVTLTPTIIGAAPASHTHTSSQITDFVEAAQDAVGTIISGTGIATVTYNDTANTIVVNATETDTLDSVTDRGATTTNGITVGSLQTTGNVIVGGNLTVNGTTTTVNSNEVNIGDNIIVLNADETGVPSQNAGFEVERGTSANVAFIWNEVNDAWDMGNYPLQNVTIDGGSY